MNPAHQSLYEALAEAAGSGRSLGPEWEERLSTDPKLRDIAERFGRISETLGALPPVSAPSALEGRVVSTLQAGHREDRATDSLRALSMQQAPPELEALVAESMPGATQLEAPAELDQRIEMLLKGWEAEEEAQGEARVTPFKRRRLTLVGRVAAAASLLFLVVWAAPWKSSHEKERDRLVRSVEVMRGGASPELGSNVGNDMLNGVSGGVVDIAAPKRLTPKRSSSSGASRPNSGNKRRKPGASSRRGPGAQSGNQNSSTSGGAGAGRTGADLLTKLSDSSVPSHEGTRLVRISVGPDSPLVLIYREHVAVAEDGTFAVDPIEVLQPQMTPASENLFLLLQKARESFFHRYRGFRILDLGLFTEQYTTTQSFNAEIVGGKESVEFEIEPNTEGGHSYHLWVEPGSGVCLRTQEFDEEERLVSEVEYENIDFSPELVTELSGGPTGWVALDQGSSASQVLTPLWIPESYVLQGAETINHAQGGEWTSLRYTDGIGTMMILQGSEQPAAQAPTRGPAKGALTRVSVGEIGAWTTVEAVFSGQHIIVIGKRPEADLVATLVSLTP